MRHTAPPFELVIEKPWDRTVVKPDFVDELHSRWRSTKHMYVQIAGASTHQGKLILLEVNAVIFCVPNVLWPRVHTT